MSHQLCFCHDTSLLSKKQAAAQHDFVLLRLCARALPASFCTGEAVAEESLPGTAPTLLTPSSPTTGRGWRSCSCSLVTSGREGTHVGTSRFGWAHCSQRCAACVKAESEEGHGGSRRSLSWPTRAASVAATIAFRNFRALVLLSSSFSFGAGFLPSAVCAPWQPRCMYYVPLCEFRRGAHLGKSPLFAACLVYLKTSMLRCTPMCNSPQSGPPLEPSLAERNQQRLFPCFFD